MVLEINSKKNSQNAVAIRLQGIKKAIKNIS
jgi:hypothetical protein